MGCHADVMTALASQLNTSGSTAMTEGEARRVVAATIARLREQGQIVGQPEPSTVLDALTSHHTLMRSGTGSGSIAFPVRNEPENLRLRKTAWWGWEDSNLQPNDYQPLCSQHLSTSAQVSLKSRRTYF
jgi:hypothetical protein